MGITGCSWRGASFPPPPRYRLSRGSAPPLSTGLAEDELPTSVQAQRQPSAPPVLGKGSAWGQLPGLSAGAGGAAPPPVQAQGGIHDHPSVQALRIARLPGLSRGAAEASSMTSGARELSSPSAHAQRITHHERKQRTINALITKISYQLLIHTDSSLFPC